jgi:hypothetical protein
LNPVNISRTFFQYVNTFFKPDCFKPHWTYLRLVFLKHFFYQQFFLNIWKYFFRTMNVVFETRDFFKIH